MLKGYWFLGPAQCPALAHSELRPSLSKVLLGEQNLELVALGMNIESLKCRLMGVYRKTDN